MWNLTNFVVLLVISYYHCFATTVSSVTEELLTNKEDELSISSSSLPPVESPSSSSSTPTGDAEQIVEVTSPQPLQHWESTTKRRQITYDQRQEGQYNIRADLDNFMIVVIPPNPVVGVNFLDLLARSSLKRSNSKKVTKKESNLPKFSRPSISKADKPNAYGFLSRMHQQSVVPIGGHQNGKFSEFIEGRTPYKVDISSTSSSSLADHDIAKLHSPEAQVDVLPPSYPFQLHTMKPYHLEAESPSLYRHQYQPSPLAQVKFLEYFNNFGGAGSRRNAKSMRNHHPSNVKELAINTVSTSGEGERFTQKRSIDDDAYRYRIESNDDENEYVDYIDNNDSSYSLLDLLSENQIAYYKEKIPHFADILMGADELKLVGATEQCGPDGIRDRYGICHFFPEIINNI